MLFVLLALLKYCIGTVYLPDSTSAVSSTDDGHAIVWESSFANVFLEDPSSESKVMRSVSKVRFRPYYSYPLTLLYALVLISATNDVSR